METSREVVFRRLGGGRSSVGRAFCGPIADGDIVVEGFGYSGQIFFLILQCNYTQLLITTCRSIPPYLGIPLGSPLGAPHSDDKAMSRSTFFKTELVSRVVASK